jgi:hypothetical protein
MKPFTFRCRPEPELAAGGYFAQRKKRDAQAAFGRLATRRSSNVQLLPGDSDDKINCRSDGGHIATVP